MDRHLEEIRLDSYPFKLKNNPSLSKSMEGTVNTHTALNAAVASGFPLGKMKSMDTYAGFYAQSEDTHSYSADTESNGVSQSLKSFVCNPPFMPLPTSRFEKHPESTRAFSAETMPESYSTEDPIHDSYSSLGNPASSQAPSLRKVHFADANAYEYSDSLNLNNTESGPRCLAQDASPTFSASYTTMEFSAVNGENTPTSDVFSRLEVAAVPEGCSYLTAYPSSGINLSRVHPYESQDDSLSYVRHLSSKDASTFVTVYDAVPEERRYAVSWCELHNGSTVSDQLLRDRLYTPRTSFDAASSLTADDKGDFYEERVYHPTWMHTPKSSRSAVSCYAAPVTNRSCPSFSGQVLDGMDSFSPLALQEAALSTMDNGLNNPDETYFLGGKIGQDTFKDVMQSFSSFHLTESKANNSRSNFERSNFVAPVHRESSGYSNRQGTSAGSKERNALYSRESMMLSTSAYNSQHSSSMDLLEARQKDVLRISTSSEIDKPLHGPQSGFSYPISHSTVSASDMADSYCRRPRIRRNNGRSRGDLKKQYSNNQSRSARKCENKFDGFIKLACGHSFQNGKKALQLQDPEAFSRIGDACNHYPVTTSPPHQLYNIHAAVNASGRMVGKDYGHPSQQAAPNPVHKPFIPQELFSRFRLLSRHKGNHFVESKRSVDNEAASPGVPFLFSSNVDIKKHPTSKPKEERVSPVETSFCSPWWGYRDRGRKQKTDNSTRKASTGENNGDKGAECSKWQRGAAYESRHWVTATDYKSANVNTSAKCPASLEAESGSAQTEKLLLKLPSSKAKMELYTKTITREQCLDTTVEKLSFTLLETEQKRREQDTKMSAPPPLDSGSEFQLKLGGMRIRLYRKLSARCRCQFDVWEAEAVPDGKPEIVGDGMVDARALFCFYNSLIAQQKVGKSMFRFALKLFEIKPEDCTQHKYKFQSIVAEGKKLKDLCKQILNERSTADEKKEFLENPEGLDAYSVVNSLQSLMEFAGSASTQRESKALPVPHYLWIAKGVHLQNGNAVLGVAMEMIRGRSLTQLLPVLQASGSLHSPQLVLEIALKIIESQRVLAEQLPHPIINWDTKPGNILLKIMRSSSGSIHCRRAVIIDLGDALPGPDFWFPSKHTPGKSPGYVICTRGYCSPECAIIVFLLASGSRGNEFRKVWYGEGLDAEQFHEVRKQRLASVWKGWLKSDYLRKQMLTEMSKDKDVAHGEGTPALKPLLSSPAQEMMESSLEPLAATGEGSSALDHCSGNTRNTGRSIEGHGDSAVTTDPSGTFSFAGAEDNMTSTTKSNKGTKTGKVANANDPRHNAASDKKSFWEVRFTAASVVFSTGLILGQLFGGPNVIQVVKKDDVRAIDALCEWNCTESNNLFSNQRNLSPEDLLPSSGPFSEEPWKGKLQTLLEGCLAFLPGNRWSFDTLEEYIRGLQADAT